VLSKSCDSSPSATTLHDGESFRLIDWRCPGHDHTPRREEYTDAYEIVVTRRGVYSREIGRTRVLADASTVAFWNASEGYRIRHPVPGGDACTVFQLHPTALAELVPRALDVARFRFSTTQLPLSGPAYLLHHAAFRAAQRGAVLASEELGLAFLSQVVAPVPVRPAPPHHADEYAHRVHAVLGARYAERLTLSAIAHDVGCSPYHLTRLVRQASGRSIHQLLIRIRLRAALEQLLDTTDDIAPIALRVGFASHSHFTHAFRREFAMTPAALRASPRLGAVGTEKPARRPVVGQ
jgi:AraC family transcriptional regulator